MACLVSVTIVKSTRVETAVQVPNMFQTVGYSSLKEAIGTMVEAQVLVRWMKTISMLQPMTKRKMRWNDCTRQKLCSAFPTVEHLTESEEVVALTAII